MEPAAATEIRVDEELEEAEFYIAQEMFEEAEAILTRVLEAASRIIAAALLRSGEVAAARGKEPDARRLESESTPAPRGTRAGFEDIGSLRPDRTEEALAESDSGPRARSVFDAGR